MNRRHVAFRVLPALLVLSSPAAAQLPLRVWWGSPGEGFGRSARDAGDVDGDGRDDVIVGSPVTDPWGYDVVTGPATRVLSGATGAELLVLRYGPASASFGFAVEGLGDVDGDGRADVAVAAPRADLGGGVVGVVRAYSGASGALLWQRPGPTSPQMFGFELAGTGDLDGDGARDLFVGAFGLTSISATGSVHAVSGATGGIIWSAVGVPDDKFGAALASLGDVDGDGLDDAAVGAPYTGLYPDQTGAVHVLSGADGASLRVIPGRGSQELFGMSVGAVGDVDGDGRADLVAYTPNMSPVGGSLARVHSGLTGAVLLEVDPETGTELAPRILMDRAGDFDGDGTPDFLTGTGHTATVRSGVDGAPLGRFFPAAPFRHLVSAALGGDIDGDGGRDLLIASLVQCGMPGKGCQGEVRAFAGRPAPDHALSCSGDGTSGPCPCGNSGNGGAGCYEGGSVAGWSGALLLPAGSTSAQADDLRLTFYTVVVGMPAVLFAGTTHVSAQPFGDGLRCAGGALVRLATEVSAFYSVPFGPGLVALGGWSAGERATFQVWYRAPSSPCGSGFNLSNAVDVLFGP